MSAQTLLVVEIAGYLVAARVLVKWFRGCWRDLIFATLNIAALYLFFFRNPAQDGGRQLSTFMTYLVVVVWQFVMFRLFAGKKGRLPWLAFFAPILVLILDDNARSRLVVRAICRHDQEQNRHGQSGETEPFHGELLPVTSARGVRSGRRPVTRL